MPRPFDNQLLATLPEDDFSALEPHLQTTELRRGQILAQSGDEITRVHFPHSGIISCVVQVADGDIVQTGMVGRDGAVGVAQALDDKVSINRIIVQLPGTASVINRDALREAVRLRTAIRSLLASYEQFFVAVIQQTAACNALHPVRARMCRWMLRMNELVGENLPLTQDDLAAMIGVRRTSVTDIAGQLHAEGLITYKRGNLHIEDVGGLKQSSCECHEAVQQNYQRLFSRPPR
jgi:CRP-like cAMP-binding protein